MGHAGYPGQVTIWCRVWLGLVLVSACSPDEPPHLWGDAAWIRLDGAALPDHALASDGPPIPGDGPVPCLTGTPDNCQFCGDVCPPGMDTPSTARFCTKQCVIECKEEYYDVNGSATDGCEQPDDVPVHDSQALAQDLGQISDCDNAKSAGGILPSDDRRHLKAPTDRPNGRADWFKIFIDDDMFCIVQAEVKVSLKGLSPSASYRLTAAYHCKGGLDLPQLTKTSPGGKEVTLKPSSACTTVGDDSGTLYIEVAKESGPHSAAGYTLEVTP